MLRHIYVLIITQLLIASSCTAMKTSLVHKITTPRKLTSSLFTIHPEPIQPLAVNTIYKNFTVTEPVLIDLFKSPTMERIKHVRQYGALDYAIKQKKDYTRYEHCVGVWALLRMYGASLEEQIAGLLHDASHTVFSHVGDVLFNHNSTHSSYQDDIHEWYLKRCKIDTLLAKHDIHLDAILHKSGAHTMLEQDLPHICADRLEYNLQAGILTDMLTLDDISTILKDLNFSHGSWFFANSESAKKLALVSLFNTEHVWCSPANDFIYTWAANALRRALEIELLNTDDIHFSTDPIVWDKLLTSNDEIIKKCMQKIVNYKEFTQSHDTTLLLVGKFRGLDPLVQKDDQLMKLTHIDAEYCKEYNRVKNRLAANKIAKL